MAINAVVTLAIAAVAILSFAKVFDGRVVSILVAMTAVSSATWFVVAFLLWFAHLELSLWELRGVRLRRGTRSDDEDLKDDEEARERPAHRLEAWLNAHSNALAVGAQLAIAVTMMATLIATIVIGLR